MTTIQHAAWYSVVIANAYSAADKLWPFIVFFVISVVLYVASCFERDR